MSSPVRESLSQSASGKPRLWLPALIAIAGALASAWVGYTLHAQNRERLMSDADETARDAAEVIRSRLDNEIFGLEMMAHRWFGGVDEDKWLEEANRHVEQVCWVQAIEWVDAAMKVRWIVPEQHNTAAVDLRLDFEPLRRRAATKARDDREIVATETVDLVQGGTGFLVFVPIHDKGEFEGYTLGVYRYDSVFDSALEHLALDYRLSVHDANGQLYGRGEEGADDLSHSSEVSVHNIRWNVHAIPGPEAVRSHLTAVPDMIALAGTLVALLVAVLVHFGRVNRWRTAGAHATNEVLRDEVERRKRAEVARREAHDELERIMGSISDYLWSAEVEPETGLVYRYHSPVVERITGRPPEFYLAGPDRFLSTVHPDDRAGIMDAIATVTAGAVDLMARDYRIVLPDQTVRWVRDTVRVTHFDDGRIRLDGVVTDLTETKRAEEERRRLEAQIQHAQKLESLGILAGGVAHDFNNLLVGILGNAQLALMHVESNADPRPLLKELENAAERAADLTKQLLNCSGRGKFVVRAVDCNELVRDVSRLLALSISKNTRLNFDLAGSLPSIEADPTQVRQIIMNLITNASEAIGERDGVVIIKTGVMYADRSYFTQSFFDDELPEGDYVYLEVSDTGCGMDSETKSKLFDPFFTTKRTGRGLGMAAALGIVRAHGGAIRVDSEPNRGSTFRVLFPASSRPSEEPERRDGSEPPWRGSGTILVADDEETVRNVAKAALESSGFDVLLAEDGHEAVRQFEEHARDISAVVLDLTMPRMNGIEALEAIKRIDHAVQVVLCSGYAECGDPSQLTSRGAAVFIQKPYGPSVLLDTLREVLKA